MDFEEAQKSADQRALVAELRACNALADRGVRKVARRAAKRRQEILCQFLALYELAMWKTAWGAFRSSAHMRCLDPDDLYQEATLGLLHALNTFDLGADYPFATHAKNWIRCYVNNARWGAGFTVHIPTGGNTDQELAGGLMQLQSLNNRLPDGREYGDLLVDPNWEPVERSPYAEGIETLLEPLTEKQRKAVEARYGFDSGEERTWLEAGAATGMNHKCVRLYCTNALRKCRARAGDLGWGCRSDAILSPAMA